MAKAKVATIGDNIDDDRKALFFGHLRERMKHDAKLKGIREDRLAAGKLAQADKIVLEDLDYAIRSITAEDKQKVRDRYTAHGEILVWLGLASGYQADLFKDRMPQAERVARAGELAGLANRDAVSGYAPNSTDDSLWMDSYVKGQAFMKEHMATAMERAAAERRLEAAALIKKPKKRKDDTPFEAPEEEQTNVEKEADRQSNPGFN